MPAAAWIGFIVLAGVIGYFLRMRLDSPDRERLARLSTRDEDYLKASELLEERNASIQELQREIARLESDLRNERKTAAEKLELLENSEERLKKEFETVAMKILQREGKNFSEQSGEKLTALLKPFREQMEAFRKRVDEVHTEDTKRTSDLLAQVRQLQETSNRVSEDANNLAKAIKGDSKAQGSWGEMIVERIFEASGLVKGREYLAQESHSDGTGKRLQTDFEINLPGERVVVVDSKVSLTAFERFVSSEDEGERKRFLKEHLASVRQHLKELSGKNYQDIMGNRSLDFVIMCIPLEPAYVTALQEDRELIEMQSRGNVVISGPSTLLITLKLIAQIWRREKENQNAELIADRAGKLYDKVNGLVEALEETRKKFRGASESLDKAFSRMSEGRGNLLSRTEELRKLGAKTTKRLPGDLLESEAPPEEPKGLF